MNCQERADQFRLMAEQIERLAFVGLRGRGVADRVSEHDGGETADRTHGTKPACVRLSRPHTKPIGR